MRPHFPRLIFGWTATPRTALGALLAERERKQACDAALLFPENLTPAERRSVEAYMRVRNQTKLARELGLERWTVHEQIAAARLKAGASTTTELLARYRAAQRSPA